MVVKRQCSFCAREIEPGTGTMFVKRDGTVFTFCSSSCRKQQLVLGRVGHRFKWTRAYELKRAAERSTLASRSASAPAAVPLAAARVASPGSASVAEEPGSPGEVEPAAEEPVESPEVAKAAETKPAKASSKKTSGAKPRAKAKSAKP